MFNKPSSTDFVSTWLCASVVFVTIVFLTGLHLPYPLNEDQAMFMYAAREMADGARMYGEFWDMKQPGIYWWYLATGHFFGFDAFGLRLMDMCWALAVALISGIVLRSRGSLASVLGPCLAFSSFYANTTSWHLSQVEWLVCGPMVVILWCVCHRESDLRRFEEAYRYAMAGAMLSVVCIFKIMVAPVAGAMVAMAILHARWTAPRRWADLLMQRAVPTVLGSMLVLGPIAAWMAWNDTLEAAIWTAFVYPALAVHEYQRHSVHMLLDSVRWFVSAVWAILPWAMWGAYKGLTRRGRIELVLITWIICAFATVSVQILSYWQYHFDLFFIPVGMLAALGFVDAIRALGATSRPVMRWIPVAILSISVAATILRPLIHKAQTVFATGAFKEANRRAFAIALDGGWRTMFVSADAVKGMSRETDRIVVWGNPIFYSLVGRRPIVQIDGGTFYLASQLEQVAAVIQRQHPVLVYLSKYRDYITYHGTGAVPRVVKDNYVPVYEDAGGVWYQWNGVKATQL